MLSTVTISSDGIITLVSPNWICRWIKAPRVLGEIIKLHQHISAPDG